MKRENLNGIRRKAAGSWWEDGVVETLAGLGTLLVGGVGLVGCMLEGRASSWVYFSLIALIVALTFTVRRAVVWIKERWIWPRTGYAVVKGRNVRRILMAYVLLAVLIGVAFVFPSYLPIIAGIMGGSIFLSMGLRYGPRRFYLLALLSVLLGLSFQIVGLEGEVAVYTMLIVLGASEMAMGTVRFLQFKKEVLG